MDRVIMPDHKMGKVIIVGAGVFGLSAALIISQRWPNLQISIVDKPSRNAPSQDISKIVRIDYNNEPWMIEALEARRRWISGPFAEFQRTVGRIVIHDKDDFSTLLDIDDTRTKLGLPTRQRGDEKLMQDKFPTTNAPPSLTYVSAPDDMIVDWAPCMSKAMERARQACTDSGGIFYESGVETIIKKASHITALVLENGEEINADNAQVVLAVGPWLTQVLATSDIRLPPNERKPVATGLFSYTVQLDKEQAKYFRDKPVVSHNGTAEFVPPAGVEDTGKITVIHPFTNLDGSGVSRVEDLSNTALAKSHMEMAITWARIFLPDLEGAHITSIASLWDGVTDTQDPLIARHPDFDNLVCAAGGSYHNAKYLPTLGDAIADVLDDLHIPDRYGWEPTGPAYHSHTHLVSRGDFAAMENEAKAEQEQAEQDLDDANQQCLAVI